MLPKTRSGKIMRRVFKAVVLGRDPGDITTIEEEGSVEEARKAWETMRAELGNIATGPFNQSPQFAEHPRVPRSQNRRHPPHEIIGSWKHHLPLYLCSRSYTRLYSRLLRST